MGATRELEIVPIPVSIRCPISLELMRDPVTLCTGITYDRSAIEKWIDAGNTICPVTNQTLVSTELIPNHALRRHIQSWCQRSGVDRIPTPRTPVGPDKLEQLATEIAAGDTDAVTVLRTLAEESERLRRMIRSSSAPAALAGVFAETGEGADPALEALAAVLPLPIPAQKVLLSSAAMSKLVAAVENRNSAAVAVLRDLSESEHGEISCPGVAAALARYISAAADTATAQGPALQCLLNVVAKRRSARAEAAGAGAVGAVLEFLVCSTDKRYVELGLALFGCLMASTEGRAAAYEHALAVPVLVKKLLRVSDVASELAVAALWRLCVNSSDEAIQDEVNAVGGFQKLLVMMQLGRSGAKVRHMASELLKMLHARGAVNQDECMSRTLALPFVRRSFE